MSPSANGAEVASTPQGWNFVGLMDLVSVRSGQVSPLQEPYRSMVLVAPDHVESGTGRILAKESAARQRAISGKYLVKPGDIIYSKIRPYLQKAALSDFTGLCSADMYPLKPRPGVDSAFILNLILSQPFTDFATSVSARSGIPKINRVELAEFMTTAPPPAEQKAIGQVLTDIDFLIASIERLITKKQSIKHGMMQQLLTGKTRLPGFTTPWVDTTLGEIASIKTGSRNNQDKTASGRYPFFVRSATVERIDSYSYSCEAILVPGEGGIGSIFHYINGKFEVHQRVYKIGDFADSTCGRYVYYSMLQFFGPHAMENSVKATVDSLRLPTFTNFLLRLPAQIEEQRAIAEALDDAALEIGALEHRLAKVKGIKQGVMQELLNGRTRLQPSEASQ